MTDKVQKIREYLVGMAGAACCDAKTKKNIETSILPFIDSLQEEPVSEKLEDAAKHYLYSNILYDDVYVGNPTDKDCIEMFKAGYKLGKEQAKVEIQAQSMAFANGCPKEEPVSEDLEKEIDNYVKVNGYDGLDSIEEIKYIANYFAKWQKEHLWKPADGDDLPEIDIEVIALLDNGKVVFAHRPPEYWDGKNIVTGKVTRHYPKSYDKGGWNIPNVKYWLNLDLPNKNE